MFTGGISGDFLDRMSKRIEQWSGKTISARIYAPDELMWWYWLEVGTAGPYPIDPINAKMLKFPGDAGEAVYAHHVEHPGIAPRHSVLQAMPEIQAQASVKIAEAMSEGGLDDATLLQAAVNTAVKEAKTQIAESIATNIPGTREDGRLLGQTASSVFDAKAVVIENGE